MIEGQAIPAEWTTPLLAVASTGSEIIWSAGSRADGNFAPDLYRFVPGASEPELVAEGTTRQSNLLPVAGSRTGYAYVEQITATDLSVRWTLWYLPVGGSPQKLDEMDPEGGLLSPAPTLAMSDRWLVWTAQHEEDGQPTSSLSALDLASLSSRRLASGPAAEVEYWFPALDDERLVFGVVEHGSGGSERIVHLLDLAGDGGESRRLDATGEAAMPVIDGQRVVWKESDDNALAAGTLVVYSLETETVEPISFGAEEALNSPSLGGAWVAAWARDPTTFAIVNLGTKALVVVEQFHPASIESNVRPHVRGQLMAWSHVLPDRTLELRWTQLPD